MTTKKNSEIEGAAAPVPSAPDIEIGWIVAGRLHAVDRAAVEQARDAALEFMRERLPEFVWRMPRANTALNRKITTSDEFVHRWIAHQVFTHRLAALTC